MTKDIIKALGKRQVLRDHTPVVANITTMFDWEVDLFSVNKGGMTYEFEVKISRADFLRDKKKKKWEMFKWKPKEKLPNYVSFACPEGLIKINEIPKACGLYYYHNGEITEVRAPRQIHDVKKNSYDINFKIARMYSQREFLDGCTLLGHLNKEIRQRTKKWEDEHRAAQERMMELFKNKNK